MIIPRWTTYLCQPSWWRAVYYITMSLLHPNTDRLMWKLFWYALQFITQCFTVTKCVNRSL